MSIAPFIRKQIQSTSHSCEIVQRGSSKFDAYARWNTSLHLPIAWFSTRIAKIGPIYSDTKLEILSAPEYFDLFWASGEYRILGCLRSELPLHIITSPCEFGPNRGVMLFVEKENRDSDKSGKPSHHQNRGTQRSYPTYPKGGIWMSNLGHPITLRESH